MIFFVNLFSLLLLYFGYCQLFVCIFSSPNTNCDQPYTFPFISFIQPQSQFNVKSIPCSLPTMIPIERKKNHFYIHIHFARLTVFCRTLNMDRKLAIFLITIINASDHCRTLLPKFPSSVLNVSF